MKRRRQIFQAKHIAIFPVLMMVERDDETGRTLWHPLPVEQQWQLVWMWLILCLMGWCNDMVRYLKHNLKQTVLSSVTWARQSRWGVRATLEINIALILGRQLGLAALGR